VTALLRAGLSGWNGGTVYPNESTAGCQIPAASLYRVSSGATAAAANTALGVMTNSGWSYASGTWTVPANSVFYGLYCPSGIALISTSNATVESCMIRNSYTGAPPWTALTAAALNDLVQPVPTTGAWFKCTTLGTTGATQPTWPGSGTVSDGSVVWTFDNAFATWAPSTLYSLNQIVQPTVPTGAQFICTTAGTSGSTEPTWPTVNYVNDGTVVWKYQPLANYCGYLSATAGTTIQNCTLGGYDSGINRISYVIDSTLGNDTNLLIQNSRIFNWRVGINCCPTITAKGNLIHNAGFVPGDHTECMYINGATPALLVQGNTLLNSITETAALYIDSITAQTGCTVSGNLMAGGGYSLYSGDNSASNMMIQNNVFSTAYYATSGNNGPVYTGAHPDFTTSGNSWTNNTWYDGPLAGQLIAAP
jgi:hypothetical protein